MAWKRPFCICGHSFWSHHTGFYDADGWPAYSGALMCICERMGCDCLEYSAEAD